MFYLRELFLLGREHKALFLANAALMAMFIASFQFQTNIKAFFSQEGQRDSSPYFNALVESDKEADYLARKMGNLPGVVSVEVKKEQKLQKEAAKFLKEIGESSGLVSAGYSAFKIVLDKSASDESKQLIREYFQRLAGSKEVTFSPVKTPAMSKLKASPLYNIFARYAPYYLALIAGIGWLFSLWLISQPLRAQCFVVERFQRKKSASLKVYAWLWGIPALVFGSWALLYSDGLAPEAAAGVMLLFAAGSLMHAKKAKSPGRFI